MTTTVSTACLADGGGRLLAAEPLDCAAALVTTHKVNAAAIAPQGARFKVRKLSIRR
jgi:hypothetical protein